MALPKPLMSQKEYLKKYLTPKTGDKKRKKKKKIKTTIDKRSVIVDDDEVKELNSAEDDESDLFQVAEDAPQIVGIIDERPDALRTLETFRTARWKVLADDSTENMTASENISKIVPGSAKSNTVAHYVDLSPKRARRYSSDSSPPRNRKQDVKISKGSSQKYDQNSGSDRSQLHRSRNQDYEIDELKHYKKEERKKQQELSLAKMKDKVRSDSDASPSRNAPREEASKKKDLHSDSDVSLPRSRKDQLSSSKRKDSHSDSDVSPPRNKKDQKLPHKIKAYSNFNSSSPQHRKESNRRRRSHSDFDESAPQYNKETKTMHKRKGLDSDGDMSPRRYRKESKQSLKRKDLDSDSDSDASPVRHRRKSKMPHHERNLYTDASPNQYRKQSQKRNRSNSDSDASPSRNKEHQKLSAERKYSDSPPRKSPTRSKKVVKSYNKKSSGDSSDASPPRTRLDHKSSSKRERLKSAYENYNRKKEKYSDRNVSPFSNKEQQSKNREMSIDRYGASTSIEVSSKFRKRYESDVEDDIRHVKSKDNDRFTSKSLSKMVSDSDESPKRHGKDRQKEYRMDKSKRRSDKRQQDYSSDSEGSSKMKKKRLSDSPKTTGVRTKYVSSKQKPTISKSVTSGHDSDASPPRLQSSESAGIKTGKKETSKNFEKQNKRKALGGQEAPIYRDRKTGNIRNLEEEAKQQQEESKKTNETREKYSRWGKGLAQVAAAKEKLDDALHEMSKPVARYADDDDLDSMLRAQDREGDPMLDYIRSKSTSCAVPSKPKYQGSWMPNRFNIPPGHRWDGVDRSNGYEKRWFEQVNARKAHEEEAHKWSVADM